MTLTNSQLVRLIATDTKLSLNKSSVIFKVLTDTLIEALAKGDSITIRGFGKFCLKYQKQRMIRHPLTHKRIIVGPKKTVKFKCFKSLYHEINSLELETVDMNKFKKENEIILQQLFELIESSGGYVREEN